MIISFGLGEYKLLVYPIENSIIKVGLVKQDFNEEQFKGSLTVNYQNEITPKVIDTKDIIYVLTNTTIVEINKESGLLTFKDITGKLLLEESQSLSKPGCAVSSVVFKRDSKEKYYGAGERGHSLALEGVYYNYNRHNYGTREGDPRIKQMSICVPWLVSSKGYGILFDDFSASRFTIDKTLKYETDSPYLLSYFFINGENIANTVQLYTVLTGRQPLPPLWILGYNSSRFNNQSQEDTLESVNNIKELGFPLDSVLIDLFWQGSVNEIGSHSWSSNFSQHTELISVLKKNNIHTTVLVSPYITSEGSAQENYKYCVDNNLFCTTDTGESANIDTWYSKKPTGLLDVTKPDTKLFLFSKYLNILSDDIDGMWCDLGEPEYHPKTCNHYSGLKSWQYHNKYSNDWTSIIYGTFKSLQPNKRPVLLTRSGTTGIQNFSTFTWSGDVYKGWSGLQCQVKMMLSCALSGIGYHSSDIGGFAQPSNKEQIPELYVRWLQLGLFSPVLRTHSQKYAEPYYYPEQNDIIMNILKERYAWLPYNYSAAYLNSLYGIPLCKPLNFFQTHKSINNVSDEYFWGDNVLVAPILSKGKTSRKVVFPQGTWVDYYDPSKRYEEFTTEIIEAPLDRIPIFIRESSFIVRTSQEMQNTSEYDPTNLDVHLYYGFGLAEYTLYDDDFISSDNIHSKNYSAVKFSATSETTGVYLLIKDQTKRTLQRNFNIYVHNIQKVTKVYIDNFEVPFGIIDENNILIKVQHNVKTLIRLL